MGIGQRRVILQRETERGLQEWGEAGNKCWVGKSNSCCTYSYAHDWLYIVWDEEAFKALSCSQRTSNQVADNKK